jgi:hypothetical protein
LENKNDVTKIQKEFLSTKIDNDFYIVAIGASADNLLH